MFSKTLLALGVVLAISALGSALKCYKCEYLTSQPKEQQKCDNSVDCPTGRCSTGFLKFKNGTERVSKECLDARACQNVDKLCSVALALFSDATSCDFECCSTDNCNNYIPSSATGVMVTKFTLSLMVIVGLIFA